MSRRDRSLFWLCARHELKLAVRSRWTQTFAAAFAALALLVAASGYVLSGGSGFQDFARTAASLSELVILLVPLTALLLGVTAFTPDAGAAELLFSQPIRRVTWLIGKLAGLFLALAAAQSIGFGLAGLVLFARTGPDGISRFLGVASGSIVLTAVFLSVAALVAAGATSAQRARGLAVSLVLWFSAVVLFDIAVLGLASLLPSRLGSRVLMTAVIVNPVDAVRTGTLLMVEGQTAFGVASLAFLRFTGGMFGAGCWLIASALAWVIGPVAAATVRLNRADF
jgi:Cu-processing system permease protein